MRLMVDGLLNLLAGIAARPEARLSELSVLDERFEEHARRRQRIHPPGPAVHFGDIDLSIAARFAEQVRRFPERTAVLNPFFNSTREFASSPEVYRSYRLRDRPLINNNWELVINLRDELVNDDIDLSEVTDIKLYFFYTDFTAY